MYSTATTIAGVCPLTQIYILLHTKESSVTPPAILFILPKLPACTLLSS